MSGNVAIGLSRRTDTTTGRSVVRLELHRKPAARSAVITLLSPTTLRPTKTTWPALPPAQFGTRGSAGEDAQVLTATSEPEIDVAPQRLEGSRAAPTLCRFTLLPGPATVPDRADCAVNAVALRGDLIAVHAKVPSASGDGTDRGQTYRSALHLYARSHPERGWREVSANVDGYTGDAGLQRFCLLDDGVAVVEGTAKEANVLEPNDLSTWKLRIVPADPAAAEWSAGAPFLGHHNDTYRGQLACDGDKIYALTSQSTGTGRQVRTTNRIVRLIPKA